MKDIRAETNKARSQNDAGPTRLDRPTIADHEMLYAIGSGAYGEVWLARNVVGTYRAVKLVYRSKFRDERPFEREFAGMRKFEPISRTHPGLVSILHIGRNNDAGYFYYIMEVADDLVTGSIGDPASYRARTLSAELAARGKLPLADCIEIGVSLAAGLDHLHSRGLVHRDIKPSNIIFIEGDPKLADIGLVTRIEEAESFVGTFGYISPEGPGTPEADVFSLGKVLYEISTGLDRERFPELPGGPVEPSKAAVYREFNEVLLRACENDVRARCKSARELQEALRACKLLAEGQTTRALRVCKGLAEGQTTQSLSPGGANRPVSPQPIEAERKLLTVLFLEVAAAEGTDPEDARKLTQSCFEVIRPVIERFEGTIPHSQSDRVMALFGAPVPCEDHAHRAAHAALACRRELDIYSLSRRADVGKFEFRAVINTGLAVTSRANNDPGLNATGEAITLAARLLSLAAPGQILGLEESCKALQDVFNIQTLQEQRLPGRSAPVRICEISSAGAQRSKFDLNARRVLTPLVGRKRELALLRERFADAKAGHGQIILLAGEPGVGKSRLLREFRETPEAQDVTWLVGRSISFGSQIAYLPIVELLRSLFAIDEGDSETTVWRKLQTGLSLADAPDLKSALPYIAYLFALKEDPVAAVERLALRGVDPVSAPGVAAVCDRPTHSLEAIAGMDPRERRLQTLNAVRQLLLRTARRQPLILVVEDLHWIDKASEEFLVSLADSLAMARVLMLVSYRPSYRNPFPERTYLTRLPLRQLTEEETAELAAGVLCGARIPSELRNLIIGKSEGNPFFIEELLKSLVESGAIQKREDRYETTPALNRVQVPGTIQDVIMARIGRLEEPSRKALQLASVIGREFAVTLLETISNLPVPLADCLNKLKALELIYERTVFPEEVCIFKHALTQEVAYNSLLIQTRKELHSLVAAAIEELYAKRLQEFYGLLAYHYEQGEEWERALEYLQRAADHSRTVAAYLEESSLLTRAIVIAGRTAQQNLIGDLRGKRGTALARVGDWADARPDLEYALAQLPEEQEERRAELLLEVAGVCFWGLDIAGTRHYATEGFQQAQRVERSDIAAGTLGWLATVLQSDGDCIAATESFERALALGDGFSHSSLANYPLTLYLRGRLVDAARRGRQSADKLADTWAATFGLPHLGLALAGLGKYQEAMRVFDEARQIGVKFENWKFQARAIALSAGFRLSVFDFPGHKAVAEEARERALSAGFQPTVVSSSIDLIANLSRCHEISAAEKLAAETFELGERIGGWHRWLWSLRLHQARAELALAGGDYNQALTWAVSGIEASRKHCRLKYEILGRIVHGQSLAALGRTHEGIAELQNAVQLAREMQDPAILLRAASALLRIAGSDELLAETRGCAARILGALPEGEMRVRFQSAEEVRQLGALPAAPVAGSSL